MIADNLVQLAGSFSPANLALTGQLVTALGATAGTNTIDGGPLSAGQNADYGVGESISIDIRILQTLTSAGAATVQFQLVQADDAALTTNVQVIAQTDAFAYTLLVQGAQVSLRWDRAAPYLPPKRYLGLRTVIGTAALTNATGWLAAFVGKDAPNLGTNGRGPIFKGGYSIA